MIDVCFERVSKRYRIRQPPGRSGEQDFWAIRDISFEVGRGETLGLIGHNGAGKSTILKLLSQITTPTQGEIRLAGRIAALIEVGSGFQIFPCEEFVFPWRDVCNCESSVLIGCHRLE